MTGRYARHSKVMTIANRLVKQGYNRAHVFHNRKRCEQEPQKNTA